MRHSNSYPRPDDFPGTEEDWYGYLLSIELCSFGGTPNFDPIVDPEALQANEEALFAKSQSEIAKLRAKQLAKQIIGQRPSVAKRILGADESG